MPTIFTKNEKRNFQDVEAQQEDQTNFLKKVHEYEQKSIKEKKPFCRTCAVLEFKDKQEIARKDWERRNGEYAGEPLNIQTNLEQYYGEKYFEELGERLITAKESLHQPAVTTLFKEYRCNRYKHGCSINCGIEVKKV